MRRQGGIRVRGRRPGRGFRRTDFVGLGRAAERRLQPLRHVGQVLVGAGVEFRLGRGGRRWRLAHADRLAFARWLASRLPNWLASGLAFADGLASGFAFPYRLAFASGLAHGLSLPRRLTLPYRLAFASGLAFAHGLPRRRRLASGLTLPDDFPLAHRFALDWGFARTNRLALSGGLAQARRLARHETATEVGRGRNARRLGQTRYLRGQAGERIDWPRRAPRR